MKKLLAKLSNPDILLATLLGIWLIINILQGIFTELTNREAYYWFTAVQRGLQTGYFDHPPMLGVLVWLGVNLFGDTELGVRFFTILLQPIYLFLFWQVVRTPLSNWRSALTYLLTAFSIPLLQLYGWVATPDAPMMLATVLFLYCYKRFLADQSRLNTLYIALCTALLVYSEYQGVLVVGLVIASNYKLLFRWKVWVALGFALLLFTPHIVWQYEHDWVTFRHHLSGGGYEFSLGNLFNSFINLILTFNPIIFVPFTLFFVKLGFKSELWRAMQYMGIGFFVLFLLGSTRGYTQPQWAIPAVFTMLFIVTRAAERSVKFHRYILKQGMIIGTLWIAARVFAMCYAGYQIPLEIFGNKSKYTILADKMDGKPLIFDGDHTQASKYNFYTHSMAYSMPSIYKGSSEYEFMDFDETFGGMPAAVVVKQFILDTIARNNPYTRFELNENYVSFYDTVDSYIPLRRIVITYDGLPAKAIVKKPILLNINIMNPNKVPIELNKVSLVAFVKSDKGVYNEFTIAFARQMTVLPAGESISFSREIRIPGSVSTGRYEFSLSLQQPPAASWYNSKIKDIIITNPTAGKSR